MDKPKTLDSGLASVSVEMATETEVKAEGLGNVCEADNSARIEGEKRCGDGAEAGKDCPVDVDNVEENGAKTGLSESQTVGAEDVVKETSGEDSLSKGISLYVDITGSPEQGKGIDGEEVSFVVGDVVWVQSKNQSWWPVKICDPADAPTSIAKSGGGGGDDVLVWHFGINHFAWCLPNQVKPFWKDFEEMSGKNKARVFRGAVEKAVSEFGMRVKLGMTCSCSSKGNQRQERESSLRKSAKLGWSSVTSFESVPFLERLKYVARVVSTPHALDLAITQNRLSAFYSSIGHRQLPMHLLEKDYIDEDILPGPEKIEDQVEDEDIGEHDEGEKIGEHAEGKNVGDQVEDDIATKEGLLSSGSGKRKTKIPAKFRTDYYLDEAKERFHGKDEVLEMRLDSRGRKKSRYLSYPYINSAPKAAAKESISFGQDIMSPSSCKSNGEKFWKKWYKRFSDGIQNPSASELSDANTTFLLHELRAIALNGLDSQQDDDFPSVGWFFSRFRISAYHDESVDELCLKDTTSVDEAEACLSGSSALENKSKRKRPKKKEDAVKDLPAGDDGEKDANETVNPSSEKNLLTPVNRPSKSNSGRLKTKSLSGLSDVKITVASIGESVKDALKTTRKKKVKGKGLGVDLLQTEQPANIPDLNGSSHNDSHIVNHVDKEGKSDVLTVPKPDACAMNISSGLLVPCGAKPGNLVVDLRIPQVVDSAGNNAMLGLIENDGQSNGKKPAPKKRKRKEKQVPAVENIPDLNGASGEPNSVGKASRETNGVDIPGKPEKKKRKKKQTEVVLNNQRIPSHLATALGMTFSPGTSMPKKEDLISRFGTFGELQESETVVSEDSRTAKLTFVKSADASEAFKSMEKVNPFGSAQVQFRLLEPVTTKAPAQPTSLDDLRQNLQTMMAMLEKSGENLSGEMRTKLEGEIKGLMGKVSSMTTTGSSS